MGIEDTEVGSVYIVGLRNAHSVESEALQIMGRQVERLTNYPELEDRLRQHIEETKGQQERLVTILASHDTDSSSVKDVFQALMGNAAALGHSMADDEILKNTFANYAFESFEIAAYKSLIVMATEVGDQAAVPALQQSLDEEIAMQKWLESQVEPTTLKFLSLTAQDKTAKI